MGLSSGGNRPTLRRTYDAASVNDSSKIESLRRYATHRDLALRVSEADQLPWRHCDRASNIHLQRDRQEGNALPDFSGDTDAADGVPAGDRLSAIQTLYSAERSMGFALHASTLYTTIANLTYL